MSKGIKDFFGVKLKSYIMIHPFISALVVFVVVVALVTLCVYFIGDRNKTGNEEGASSEQVVDYTLTKDTNQEIFDAVVEYQNALANNDQEVIKKYILYVNQNELDNIAIRSKYVEAYNDIHCYVQQGRDDNSYVVYTSYMLKLKDFDTEVPGLRGFYYCPDENGNYHLIRKKEMDYDQKECFYVCWKQKEVQDLYAEVQNQYNAVLESDPALSDFMQNFDLNVQKELAEDVALKEATEVANNPEETTTTDTETGEETVIANTTVNVRSSDSETADKLGQVAGGTELKRLEERVNGWSKVIYDGKEGFVKSEFLTKNDPNAVATVGNTVTVKENVNIRKTADEEGERLALAYMGEKLEVIEKMSNGWTKVKYNGSEAYVKSEYVE